MVPPWRAGNWTTHLILIAGVIVFALAVYLAFVGSTHDLETGSRGEMGLTPGPDLPPVVIVVLRQRWFVRGLTETET